MADLKRKIKKFKTAYMTKDTMIFRTLQMITLGMAVNKTLPPTKEEFIEKVLQGTMSFVDYPREDIEQILYANDFMEFSCIYIQAMTNIHTPQDGK
jgi:prolyl oligopeptidase PreP (S9A serine peptidase family)